MLRKAVKAGEITWRCWWDGGSGSPIAASWGVESFPTVFVLDDKGVIRHKDLDDAPMKQAVEALLEALESSAR